MLLCDINIPLQSVLNYENIQITMKAVSEPNTVLLPLTASKCWTSKQPQTFSNRHLSMRFFLFIRKAEKERERETEFPSSGSLPECLQWWGLGQLEAKSWEPEQETQSVFPTWNLNAQVTSTASRYAVARGLIRKGHGTQSQVLKGSANIPNSVLTSVTNPHSCFLIKKSVDYHIIAVQFLGGMEQHTHTHPDQISASISICIARLPAPLLGFFKWLSCSVVNY